MYVATSEASLAACVRIKKRAIAIYVCMCTFFSTAFFSAKPGICCSGAAPVRSWALHNDVQRLSFIVC